jgi:hypothetical protein
LPIRTAKSHCRVWLSRVSGRPSVATHSGPAPSRFGCWSDEEFESPPGSQPSGANPEEPSEILVIKSDSVKSRNFRLAPQSGHVSNFCGIYPPVLEPRQIPCSQTGPSANRGAVQPGQPDWTRFEPGQWKHNFRVDDSPGRVRQRVVSRNRDAALENKICYAYWWWGLVARLFWRTARSGRQMAEAGVTVPFPACTLARLPRCRDTDPAKSRCHAETPSNYCILGWDSQSAKVTVP